MAGEAGRPRKAGMFSSPLPHHKSCAEDGEHLEPALSQIHHEGKHADEEGSEEHRGAVVQKERQCTTPLIAGVVLVLVVVALAEQPAKHSSRWVGGKGTRGFFFPFHAKR